MTDVRDLIVAHLKEIERPMTWLSKQTEIPYPTLYSILKEKTFNLSNDKKRKINEVLSTKF